MDFKAILALLTTKFSGVRKDGLEPLARVLSLQCSTEEEATTLIEKFTEGQVSDFVKEYRKTVDMEVSTGNKTFESNLRKKYDLIERQSASASKEPLPAAASHEGDIATIVANALAVAVKPLQERLDRYEQGALSHSRLQALQGKLSACKDEVFKAQTLKDFSRMQFSDENAFNEYLSEKEVDIKAANQNIADLSLRNSALPPMLNRQGQDGISQAVSDYLASQKPEANVLKGKDI